MEGRLFALSIWCWIYGQLIRLMIKREGLMERPWAPMALNSLFWATFAAMLGMLVASYSEKLDESLWYAVWFAAAGLLLGAATGYLSSRQSRRREAMIQDNLEWADTGFS